MCVKSTPLLFKILRELEYEYQVTQYLRAYLYDDQAKIIFHKTHFVRRPKYPIPLVKAPVDFANSLGVKP
jgi:hypothetical protein